MYSVTDFNFAIGIATFAATVGYAFSRRVHSELRAITHETADLPESAAEPLDKLHASVEPASYTAPNTSSDITEQTEEAGSLEQNTALSSSPTRQSSLKRKRAHDEQEDSTVDAGYPHNLTLIYPPKKRSRTPSSENDPKSAKQEPDASSNAGVILDQDCNSAPYQTATPNKRAPTPPPSAPPTSSLNIEDPRTPSPVFGSSATISSLLPKASHPTISRAATSKAFTAFAGSASAFASAASTQYPSLKSGKAAWTSEEVMDPKTEAADVAVSKRSGSAVPSHHVLAAAEVMPKSTIEHITGEENEDVELELKGVRLFVKRREKPYSDGMVGHVKLLSNKTTLDERLLFRREPLWQVSMNVRMRPTIRCTFDADEHVLRLILKEAAQKTNVPKEEWERDVVVYALKPGRSCSKQDFKDFANSLIESPGLKPR